MGTPISNGISVYERLDNGYLITQQGGPHVIFGRGNACPDDIVTAFLMQDKRPGARTLECEGVVADEYVPLPPRKAAEFEDALAAFQSAETELNYTPEYYYWDGVTPTSIGYLSGSGTLAFEPGDARTIFTLDQCAFTQGWKMTGTGSYNADLDRFVLEVKVGGVKYRYVREGDDARVVVGALVIEGFVDQAPEIVVRAPAQQELGLGIVEPGRVIGARDLDGRVAARRRQVVAHLPVVDRLVHAGIKGLLARPGAIRR